MSKAVALYKREKEHQRKLGCSKCPANKGCNARGKHKKRSPKKPRKRK